MTKDSALRMALEALETELCIDWTNNDEFNESAEKMHEAIIAIKEALANHIPDATKKVAQPEQKMTYQQAAQLINEMKSQPEQEPVAWRFRTATQWLREPHWRYLNTLEGSEGLLGVQPLYTTPPQRTWVELTDKEIKALAKRPNDIEIPMTGRMWIFVGELMKKLKEKNT